MIYPEVLSPGDKIVIVAPAGRIGNKDLVETKRVLESWGLNVLIGKHVFDMYNYFSSTDNGRMEDLQEALNDPGIRAIFCARGGYGTGRIIDRLDFTDFMKSPKWIIGFSDITLLHLKLQNLGIASLHGPVARQIGSTVDNKSIVLLEKALFSEEDIHYNLLPGPYDIFGNVKGRITGGNLTLICNSMGTSTEMDFRNKIFFLEEIDERIYALDRFFNQLERSGKLEHLNGIIVGQLTSIKDTEPSFGLSANEIVREYAAKYSIPICFGFEAGHEKRNLPIPLSFNCDLDVSKKGTSIRFYR